MFGFTPLQRVASQIYRMRPGKGKDGIVPSHCAEFRRTLVSQSTEPLTGSDGKESLRNSIPKKGHTRTRSSEEEK